MNREDFHPLIRTAPSVLKRLRRDVNQVNAVKKDQGGKQNKKRDETSKNKGEKIYTQINTQQQTH